MVNQVVLVSHHILSETSSWNIVAMKMTIRNGKSYIRNICLEDVAQEYGTPFYLYDLNDVYQKIETIRNNFGESVKLYYAIKANSNLEILKAIREKVDGLDISSIGEMEQSLLAGYSPGQLSFAGPGKTFQELEQSIRNQVGIISVESIHEMENIKKISLLVNSKVDIMIRVNPTMLIREFDIKMGGQATQFGIDEENLDEAIKYATKERDYLNFRGIHVYAGTQCMNADALAKNVGNILSIARNIQREHRLPCSVINLGGGYGVSYYSDERLDIGKVVKGIKRDIEEYKSDFNKESTFILELGRYLVAEAGLYVTTVISAKESRGKYYYILDGGMNHHLSAAGGFGQVLRKNFMVKNISNPEGEAKVCNLVGPLCTTIDLMAKDVSIESPRIGDRIAFLNSGSYGFTSSPLLFLGHKTPLEVMLYDHAIRVIRARRNLIEFN
jgi:diaminopimelate decarboxylase